MACVCQWPRCRLVPSLLPPLPLPPLWPLATPPSPLWPRSLLRGRKRGRPVTSAGEPVASLLNRGHSSAGASAAVAKPPLLLRPRCQTIALPPLWRWNQQFGLPAAARCLSQPHSVSLLLYSSIVSSTVIQEVVKKILEPSVEIMGNARTGWGGGPL